MELTKQAFQDAVKNLPRADRPFADSLVAQWFLKGKLSSAQMVWVHRLHDKATAKAEVKAAKKAAKKSAKEVHKLGETEPEDVGYGDKQEDEKRLDLHANQAQAPNRPTLSVRAMKQNSYYHASMGW